MTVFAEFRFMAVPHLAQTPPSEDKVDFPQDISELPNWRLHLPDFRGELSENAMHFRILSGRQLHQPIIQVQHIERFDKHGRPTGGMIMHNPPQEALVIQLEGNNVTIITKGDQGFLYYLFMLHQMPIQTPPNPFTRLTEIGTHLLQPGTGVIFDIAPRIDHLTDVLFERFLDYHVFANRRKQGIALGYLSKEALGLARGRQEKLAVKQLLRLKDFSLLGNLVEEQTWVHKLL